MRPLFLSRRSLWKLRSWVVALDVLILRSRKAVSLTKHLHTGKKRRFSHQLPFTEFLLSNFQIIHAYYHKKWPGKKQKEKKNERKVTRLQHPLKLGQRTTSHEESLWLTSQGLTLGSIKPYWYPWADSSTEIQICKFFSRNTQKSV